MAPVGSWTSLVSNAMSLPLIVTMTVVFVASIDLIAPLTLCE